MLPAEPLHPPCSELGTGLRAFLRYSGPSRLLEDGLDETTDGLCVGFRWVSGCSYHGLGHDVSRGL